MLDPEELPRLREEIRAATVADEHLLRDALDDVKTLSSRVHPIQEHHANAISVVASDGGNNRLEFNPYYLQLVRIVDTYGRPLLTSAVSTAADTVALSDHHLDQDTALGKMMRALGVRRLSDLSPMIPDRPTKPGWEQVYRDICEWAVLYELVCTKEFGSHTLVVRDGVLRSKIFTGDLFMALYRLFNDAITRSKREHRRDLFVVGVAKRSEILERYRLIMAVEDVFPSGSPIYAEVPMELQEKVYKWPEWLWSPDRVVDGREAPKFNMAVMHLVRFGRASGDPVWTVDILESQRDQAPRILGALLSDARVGFPVPLYPHSLQQADAYARVADLDLAVLQDTLVEAVRDQIDVARRPAFDAHRLVDANPAAARYG